MGQEQNKPTGEWQREAKLLTEAIDRANGQQFQETSRNFLQQEQDREK